MRKSKKRKEEIEHKLKLIREERGKLKVKKNVFLDKIVYWAALFIAILGNMLIAISLIPFLLTLNEVMLYVVMVVIGLSFGLFFEILVRDIEKLEKKHHIIISILIPSIAVISFFVITVVANNLKNVLNIGIFTHNPLVVAAVYAIFFILPYVVYHSIVKKRKWCR